MPTAKSLDRIYCERLETDDHLEVSMLQTPTHYSVDLVSLKHSYGCDKEKHHDAPSDGFNKLSAAGSMSPATNL